MGWNGADAAAAAARDAVRQFALPLVIRIERESPPARTDAMEAAAIAVLSMLTDERSVSGEWAGPVRAWQDGRIRKVVRRARGAAWQRACALPGIGVQHGSAELRVYPPVPVDEWPEDLARLQVSGTELEDESPPGTVAGCRPVIWLNPSLEMTAGKAMAQAGHGVQLAWWRLPEPARSEWQADGFRLAVRPAPAAGWARLLRGGLPVVRDAGFTEISPGSVTVVADHPALRRLTSVTYKIDAHPRGRVLLVCATGEVGGVGDGWHAGGALAGGVLPSVRGSG